MDRPITAGLGGADGFLMIRFGFPLAGCPRPAPAGAALWSLSRRLQSAGDILGLLEIFLAGAPEEQAAGHTADGDGDVEVAGDRLEIGFHGEHSPFFSRHLP
jgi:hypothetical protein